jgi:hypothetical protein
MALANMPALVTCLAITISLHACTSAFAQPSVEAAQTGSVRSGATKMNSSWTKPPNIKNKPATEYDAQLAQRALAARLEALGVHDADEMAAALAGFGLLTPADLGVLDGRAVAELDEGLRDGGASLGDRAKLRIRGLAIGAGGFSAQASTQARARAKANSFQPRRAQAKEGAGKVAAEGSRGLSADTLALISTAVLGIATFVLQARVAKNAEAAQQELEHARVEHEQGRAFAAVQLERVRSQMGDVYRPVGVMLGQANVSANYMARALGFEFNDTMGREFVAPLALWPHIELWNRDFGPKWLAALKGSPYRKYSPSDIALLEDPAKRQVYIEAHTDCIVPRYREVATILSTKSTLMETPPASYLDGVFPADGVDWTKFFTGTLGTPMLDMAAFAYAWAPLERRWEAGGALVMCHTLVYLLRKDVTRIANCAIWAARLTVSIRRLFSDAAGGAGPVDGREHGLLQDGACGRREGGRARGQIGAIRPARAEQSN